MPDTVIQTDEMPKSLPSWNVQYRLINTDLYPIIQSVSMISALMETKIEDLAGFGEVEKV